MTTAGKSAFGLSILIAALAVFVALRQVQRTAELEDRLRLAEERVGVVGPSTAEIDPRFERLANENQELRAEMARADHDVARLQTELEAARKVADEEPREPSERDTAGDTTPTAARRDTAAEERFLASLQGYVEDAEFVALEDLSEKQQPILRPWADRMTMIRGEDGRIGLFGLGGEGKKGLSDVPEGLQPWVEAYAAVSFHYRSESTRAIDDLIVHGRVERFSTKDEARVFARERRDAYFEENGTRHRGFSYRFVDGEVLLVDREAVESHPSVMELGDLRAQIGTRLGDRDDGDGGIMEKWTDPME